MSRVESAGYQQHQALCDACGWRHHTRNHDINVAKNIAEGHRCTRPMCAVCGAPSEFIDNKGRMCETHKRAA